MSYLDVFKIHLPMYDHALARGDFVKLGANAGPVYEVIAVRGDMAWIRDPHASDSIVAAHRCRRIGRAAADRPSLE